MAAASAIWNHNALAAQNRAASVASPAAGANDDSSSSSTNAASISANDFLTLLVTELQNQDPTAQTDPNEYIDQLVQVNSLEQLISINQTLTNSLGTTNGSVSAQTAQSPEKTALQAEHETPQSSPAKGAAAPSVAGNISIPTGNPAAERVAQSLTAASAQ